jgi:hypothetical protein
MPRELLVTEVRVHEIHHRQGGVDGEGREGPRVLGDDLGVEGGGRRLDEGVPVGEFDGDGHFVEDLVGGRGEAVERVGCGGGVGADGEEGLRTVEDGSCEDGDCGCVVPGDGGLAAGECFYSIPGLQHYFLIYFHSLTNNCTCVNFFY